MATKAVAKKEKVITGEVDDGSATKTPPKAKPKKSAPSHGKSDMKHKKTVAHKKTK